VCVYVCACMRICVCVCACVCVYVCACVSEEGMLCAKLIFPYTWTYRASMIIGLADIAGACAGPHT
jgi:hypothetical protein